MEGPEIVIAWKAWLDSEEGRKAVDPYTLGATNGARQYLQNRLECAFQAGIKAAQSAAASKTKAA
jgi:hypothetical protein